MTREEKIALIQRLASGNMSPEWHKAECFFCDDGIYTQIGKNKVLTEIEWKKYLKAKGIDIDQVITFE
jgi:hypothetical protein